LNDTICHCVFVYLYAINYNYYTTFYMVLTTMSFDETYQTLKEEFTQKNQFQTITAPNSRIKWPSGSGVYVIWEIGSESKPSLIYVGMCGKFYRNNEGVVSLNGSTFPDRTQRWTPYRFSESTRDRNLRHHFRYGPKLSNVNEQAKIKYDEDAYAVSIPYSRIYIDFFAVPEDDDTYTSTFIESLLLNRYLKQFNTLPPANNSL